jgi:hypothetical protein
MLHIGQKEAPSESSLTLSMEWHEISHSLTHIPLQQFRLTHKVSNKSILGSILTVTSKLKNKTTRI